MPVDPESYENIYLSDRQIGALESALQGSSIAAPIMSLDEVKAFVEPLGIYVRAACSQIEFIRRGLGIKDDIRFAIIDSNVSNACACRGAGVYFVVLTIGLLTDFAVGISHLLTSPDIHRLLNETPNPEQNTIMTNKRGTIELATRIVFQANNFAVTTEPYFILIKQIAIWFVVSHEMAHITNGHLSSGVLRNAFVIDLPEEDPDSFLISRALEMDADACALHQTLFRVFSMTNRRARGFVGDEYFVNYRSSVKVGLLSTAMALISLHRGPYGESGSYRGLTHPPGISRFFGLFALARIILCREISAGHILLDVDQEHMVTSVGLSVIESIIRITGIDFMEDFKAWMKTMQDHDRENLQTWAKLRPRLSQSKLGDFELAPAQF